MTPSRRVAAVLLLGLAAGGCAKRAATSTPAPTTVDNHAAAIAPSPSPAPSITAADTVATPVCLGFSPDGRSAYILTGSRDMSVPDWTIAVAAVGGAEDPYLGASAETFEADEAQARFTDLVEPINELIREHKLVACTGAEAREGRTLDATVRGTPIQVRFEHDKLVVLPDGKPPVERSQADAENRRLVTAYTAPTLPGLVVVLQDAAEGGMSATRTEWFALE